MKKTKFKIAGIISVLVLINTLYDYWDNGFISISKIVISIIVCIFFIWGYYDDFHKSEKEL